jgi:hypothetical protein
MPEPSLSRAIILANVSPNFPSNVISEKREVEFVLVLD